MKSANALRAQLGEHDYRMVIATASTMPAGPCLVCGRSTAHKGVFAPADPQSWGGFPDKRRTIIYAICKRHHPKTVAQENHVEELLRQWLEQHPTDHVLDA